MAVRLEDLPQDYRDKLQRLNLVPLWPNLRALLPPQVPSRQTRPTHWAYATLRPLLMRAGELTPMHKAERRVRVLANPGHGLDAMKASPAMYLGMQLLLPGEWAPAHRHTPNAVRMIVEGPRQTAKAGRGDEVYARGGVVPTPYFERGGNSYPMLRYPWQDARAALLALATSQPGLECAQITYVNPDTGCDVQNNLGYYALMLRPGQTLRLPARSPSQVFHAIEGGVEVAVSAAEAANAHRFNLAEADTCCTPGCEAVTLLNRSSSEPASLFIANELPLHHNMGVYEARG